MPAPLWFSIEVFDGAFAASLWQEAHGDNIVHAALQTGAVDWDWHVTSWGVVFEVAFEDEDAWERFRVSTPVQAAIDGAPDPVAGVLVYRGRGGSSGTRDPRKPRPLVGSGAAALPLPEDRDEAVLYPRAGEPRRVLVAG